MQTIPEKGSFVSVTQVDGKNAPHKARDNGRKTILIVDDDPELLEIYCHLLIRTYHVMVASSGKEAVKMVKRMPPDLIIMDVMMEDVYEGIEAARELEERGYLKTTPLIFLTSLNKRFDYVEVETEFDVSSYEWLCKPVKPAQLLAKINTLLGQTVS